MLNITRYRSDNVSWKEIEVGQYFIGGPNNYTYVLAYSHNGCHSAQLINVIRGTYCGKPGTLSSQDGLCDIFGSYKWQLIGDYDDFVAYIKETT